MDAYVDALHNGAPPVVLSQQCAAPDPKIRMDGYAPPAPRRLEPLPAIATAPTWESRAHSFPDGPEWEINSSNVGKWARHRFEHHFTERVLAQIPTPEGHPLFELRLDILEYEVLFCRYIGIPHNPQLFRAEYWRQVGKRLEFDTATTVRPSNPPMWKPPTRHLEECLRASCRDYAQGLAWYLLPGRETWGNG